MPFNASDKSGFGQNLLSLEEFLDKEERLFISEWAEVSMGKSYFILTCPPPVYLLSIESDGPIWAIKTALKNKIIAPGDLYVDEVLQSVYKTSNGIIPTGRTLEEDQAIWEYICEQVEYICEQTDEGTLAIDTGSTLWDICDEVLGEEIRAKRKKQGKDEIYTFDYRYANKGIKKLVEKVRATNLNFVISHHAKNQYSNKGTRLNNRWELDGNKQLYRWVDVQLRLRMEEGEEVKQKDGTFVLGEPERWAEIEKSRINNKDVGLEVPNPSYDNVLEALMRGQ